MVIFPCSFFHVLGWIVLLLTIIMPPSPSPTTLSAWQRRKRTETRQPSFSKLKGFVPCFCCFEIFRLVKFWFVRCFFAFYALFSSSRSRKDSQNALLLAPFPSIFRICSLSVRSFRPLPHPRLSFHLWPPFHHHLTHWQEQIGCWQGARYKIVENGSRSLYSLPPCPPPHTHTHLVLLFLFLS